MYIILRPIPPSGSTDGALEEAGRAEQHITTEAASHDLKLGEGAQSHKNGPSESWWRWGCSSGVICHLLGWDLLCAGGHTHTTCRISVWEAFRSKASKGMCMYLVSPITATNRETGWHSQFFCSESWAVGSIYNVSRPTTGLHKDEKKSGVSEEMNRLFYIIFQQDGSR